MAIEDYWDGLTKTQYVFTDSCATGSVADEVLSKYIDGYANQGIGGPLKNLDIKRMDAFTAIKLSLLDYASVAGQGLYELIVDENGDIDFVKVGSTSGLSGVTLYYTIQTKSFVDKLAHIMVTGGKPIATRKALEWKPIWGDSKILYDTQAMSSNCLQEEFKQYATIVYNDPNLDSKFKDGIDNLFELNADNPWDRIVGYVYHVDPVVTVGEDVTIGIKKPCDVPVQVTLSSIPKLVRAPTTPSTEDQPDCWAGLGDTADTEDGAEITIDSKLRFTDKRNTEIDKLMAISKAFIIGQELDVCIGIPKGDSDAESGVSTETNTDIWIGANKATKTVFTLQKGVHYAIAWEGAGAEKKPYIVLANNARQGDNAKYGYGAKFKRLPFGALYTGTEDGEGMILPTGGTKGVLVEELWVVLTLDTPSIAIHDPAGDANEIATNLVFEIAPIIIVEEPAPIGYDGRSLEEEMKNSIKDNDPTTIQELESSPMDDIIQEMADDGGMTLSLSFMEEEDVRVLSSTLKTFLEDADGVETTYICGPDSTPQLGGSGDSGGIVNSITYSYNDSGSYTISVNEGAYLIGGLTEATGGVYLNQTEEVSAQGTIIQDAGNHMNYRVRIDGFGDRWAINAVATTLRIGDKVQCTVHNNPVETETK